jgi:hypothetical protein
VSRFLDRKLLVKFLGKKALVLLFVGLVVQCAFDGPVVQAFTTSPFQEDSGFCAILDATSLEIALPIQSVSQAPSRETIDSPPEVYPRWSLRRSIDHPPEQPA